MSRLTLWTVIIILALALPWVASCGGGSKAVVQYHCPMHPTYVQDGPGECPICGWISCRYPRPRRTPLMRRCKTTRCLHTSMASRPTHATVHASAAGLDLAGVRTTPRCAAS